MKTFEDYIKQAKESKYEEVMLEITNKSTGKEGIASLLSNDRVAIYENDSTGKDDFICDLKEFKDKYEIQDIQENGEELIEEELY